MVINNHPLTPRLFEKLAKGTDAMEFAELQM